MMCTVPVGYYAATLSMKWTRLAAVRVGPHSCDDAPRWTSAENRDAFQIGSAVFRS